MVEWCSDNRLHSATVGSNLHLVWCINRSVRKLYVTIQIVEWALGFIIHALMLAEMIAKASFNCSFKGMAKDGALLHFISKYEQSEAPSGAISEKKVYDRPTRKG